MHRHFLQDLEALKTTLIRMSSVAEKSIAEAIKALLERNPELARRVINEDEVINRLEMEIDDRVVDILALQQPVASDLRLILAAQKINNDLERIGDHAVNVAESALQYAARPAIGGGKDLAQMGHITKLMLREAIDSFIHSDADMARSVLKNDDIIDDMNRKIVNEMAEMMQKDQTAINQALDLIRVSRNLERVADLATNIAEEVIFFAEAHVVKHHQMDRPPRAF
jgi:phosphate transport system protein